MTHRPKGTGRIQFQPSCKRKYWVYTPTKRGVSELICTEETRYAAEKALAKWQAANLTPLPAAVD
jgi:hypothetical protein